MIAEDLSHTSQMTNTFLLEPSVLGDLIVAKAKGRALPEYLQSETGLRNKCLMQSSVETHRKQMNILEEEVVGRQEPQDPQLLRL